MIIKAIAYNTIVFNDECEIELDQSNLDDISDIVNYSDEDDIEYAVYRYICDCYAGREAVNNRGGEVDDSFIEKIDQEIIKNLIDQFSNCCKRSKNNNEYVYCPTCGKKLN